MRAIGECCEKGEMIRVEEQVDCEGRGEVVRSARERSWLLRARRSIAEARESKPRGQWCDYYAA